MKIERFEDINAWRNSRELCNDIYKLLKSCNDYSFKNQMERAVVSIMNNIAEGFERRTNNELKQFLFIAKGSCGEVRSMLYLAEDMSICDAKIAEQLRDKSEHISRMLSNFIKAL